MTLFPSVAGYRMALLECSVIAQIKTVSADTNRLFVRVGNRAALPGNTCYTVVTTLSIRLAQRAVVLMHSPPHHYKALQRTQRPLNQHCSASPVCFQLWRPWPLSCPVVWTPALRLIRCLRAHSLPRGHAASWRPKPQLQWLFRMTASVPHALLKLRPSVCCHTEHLNQQ